MKFYTNVQQRGKFIHVRGVDEGKPFYDKIEYSPTLYIKSPSPLEKTGFKSVHGESLMPMQFNDIYESKSFLERYEGVDNMMVYGMTNMAYQYISDEYRGDVSFSFEHIKSLVIDIETARPAEGGFPDIRMANAEILLVTLMDLRTGKYITYGTRPYTGEQKISYHLCANEAELLKKVVNYISFDYPDIISGFNSNTFDMPFLVNRIGRILGESYIKQLSPMGVVRTVEKSDDSGRTWQEVRISGIALLDWLALFKKFGFTNLEQNNLDSVALALVGEQKVDHGYDTFEEFYTKDWNLYVWYNIVDCDLIVKMEKKKKLVKLAVNMAYTAHCNYEDVFSPVRTWDCKIYHDLLETGVVVPNPPKASSDRQIAGGFVKEPIAKRYGWVVSFDAASLYPSIIQAWNISPETIIDALNFGFAEPDVRSHLLGKIPADIANQLYTLDYSMALNGQCFSRNKQGIFPAMVERIFNMRKNAKGEMKDWERKVERIKLHREGKTQDEFKGMSEAELAAEYAKCEDKIGELDSVQMSAKIFMNSLYGATANTYFRFFDHRIAEGITLSGQYIIQKVGIAINEYLNKVMKTEGFDYSFYTDTDSCYVTLEPLVNKLYKDKTNDEIHAILDKICETKLTEVINNACIGLGAETNSFKASAIYFKREAISTTGIWVAKKKYALAVLDMEGVKYAHPKVKVQGLEIVRTSTPQIVRNMLSEAVERILMTDENTVQAYIEDCRLGWKDHSPEEIAFPKSAKNLQKYRSPSTIFTKGCPIQVRAALLFNHFVDKYKLTDKYQYIGSGDKIKFLYLKEPNTIRSNAIGFVGKMPEEFGLHKYIDYDTMFEKTFLKPISSIMGVIGWSSEKVSSLDDFFV